MLLLGLEYSASELTTNLRTQAPAGLVNIVANGTPGVVIGLILQWPLAAVVAMGGVTYATSSGITAKVLTDLGRLGNRETPVVLSLLVLEDLSMALYLPVLTAMLAGVTFWAGLTSVAIALAAISVALLVALRYGRQVGRFVFSENREVLLLIVFGLALLVAGIAQSLQVSEAVGAFLVGIALSGRVAESARSVLSPLRDLFAAVFFVFFGLRTDPTEIPSMLLPALALARDHRADQDRGRVLGGPAGQDRHRRPDPGRHRDRLARRVQYRHRRAGHRLRHHRPGICRAGGRIRADPGHHRPVDRPGRRAGRPGGGPTGQPAPRTQGRAGGAGAGGGEQGRHRQRPRGSSGAKARQRSIRQLRIIGETALRRPGRRSLVGADGFEPPTARV